MHKTGLWEKKTDSVTSKRRRVHDEESVGWDQDARMPLSLFPFTSSLRKRGSRLDRDLPREARVPHCTSDPLRSFLLTLDSVRTERRRGRRLPFTRVSVPPVADAAAASNEDDDDATATLTSNSRPAYPQTPNTTLFPQLQCYAIIQPYPWL